MQNISQSSQSTELMPLYSHQPVQVVYPSQPSQSSAVMYPSHSIIYTQNPVYPNMMVPVQNIPQNVPYPQNSSTPNSCTSASNSYTGQMQEQGVPMSHNINQLNYNQLTHSMSHLTISSNQMGNMNPPSSNQNIPFNQNMAVTHLGQQFDMRIQKNNTPKGNKFSTPKNIVSGSSQSSTGTSSPAATVIAGYCSNNPSTVPYRTPPETPPTQNVAFGYGPNFVPPMIFKQVSLLLDML